MAAKKDAPAEKPAKPDPARSTAADASAAAKAKPKPTPVNTTRVDPYKNFRF